MKIAYIQRNRKIKIPIHYWWEEKIVSMENNMGLSQNTYLKIELSCDSAVTLLGTYPKNIKMIIQNEMCTSTLIA